MPVETRIPDGVGTVTGNNGTPTGAATRWECVETSDGDTTYVRWVGSAGWDVWVQVEDVATAPSIISVKGLLEVRTESGLSARGWMKSMLGAVVVNEPSQNFNNTSYETLEFPNMTHPGGGDWTIADFDSCEFGWQIVGNEPNVNTRVTYMALEITYAEANWGGRIPQPIKDPRTAGFVAASQASFLNSQPLDTPLDTGWAQQGVIHPPPPAYYQRPLFYARALKAGNRGIVVPWDNRKATPPEGPG